jgi:exoribonuclease R
MAYLETKDYRRFQFLDQDGLLTDEFEGYDSIKPAYHGDLLGLDRSIQESALKPPFVGVLHIQSKTIYGMSSRGVPIYFFEPLDPKFPPMIVGCSTAKSYSKNILVLATFEKWNKADKYPRGILQTILGECGDLETEKKALLHRYSPFPYPKAKTISLDPGYLTSLQDQKTLKGYTFNIDPVGCVDVDDIFTLERIYDGWRLTISITDVACGLPTDHPLYSSASRLGQTIYPDEGEPKHMLPPSIGIEMLSLLPGKLRNVISLTIDWTATASLSQPIWSLRTAAVDKAYTYEEANLDSQPELQVLRQLTEAIAGRPLVDSHEWVETAMLFYNKEAGKLLQSAGIGILRAHSAPDAEKLEKMIAIHSDLKLYAFSSASYVDPTQPAQHWGIGADAYAHASSPLRRFADLYNQQCIRGIILGTPTNTYRPSPKLLRDLNRLQKDAKAYERDIFFVNILCKELKKLDGIVVATNSEKRTIQVYVPEWKRIIKVRQGPEESISVESGQGVQVSYYVKADCARWKDKIIFRLEV